MAARTEKSDYEGAGAVTQSGPPPLGFAWRALIATGVAAAGILLLLFVWQTADLLLLVFAGVLVSILLRGFSRMLRERAGLGHALSLLSVCLALVFLIAAAFWLVADQVGAQVSELREQVPKGLERLRAWVEQYSWAENALQNLPSPGEWLARRGSNVLQRFTGMASITLSALINLLLIAIIGVYLASEPELYSRGLRHLIPVGYRDRAGDVLSAIDGALWRWLVGRFGLMLLNGGLTAAGLWALGVQSFLTLGLLAGLLNFIPNFGPWIAAIPAVLVGLLANPWQALYIALLYLGLQGVDGYVLTPLVDRRSVSLPPVVTITAQVLLGATFGFLGLLLASPLTAGAMIAIRKLYVEDLLGDSAG
jgi:predicted PurR-regulated permease PerM